MEKKKIYSKDSFFTNFPSYICAENVCWIALAPEQFYNAGKLFQLAKLQTMGSTIIPLAW
jgi:hypothetical protein